MREFFYAHVKLEHLLCVLILVSRVGDIGSTYLLTPNLKLEANPIMRKLGWWFAVATILVCFIPYYSTALGILVLVPSLMVSASNTSKIWFVRACGESEYLNLLHSMAKRSKLWQAILATWVSMGFTAMVGFLLWLLCPDPRNWGYWFGEGVMLYSLAIGFYGTLYLVRLFRNSRRNDDQSRDAAVP